MHIPFAQTKTLDDCLVLEELKLIGTTYHSLNYQRIEIISPFNT